MTFIRHTHEEMAEAHGFELCRSDADDGGWSLHLPGAFEPIVSGPAIWDAHDSDWNRPNAVDYAAAKALALMRAA